MDNLLCLFPKVAEEWHPTKNGELQPSEVTPYSSKKVWWIGKCGHEWQASVANRTKGRTGCPYCSGNKVLAGFNDLATVYPQALKEWDNEKNSVLPDEVTRSSSHRIWWICSKGHSYEATVREHVIRGRGCPFCAGRKVLPGFNDLDSLYPALSKEWHPTKNGDLTAKKVSPHSNRIVWWECERGHEWEAKISERTSGHSIGKCPICLNRRVCVGVNDFQSQCPTLVAEWHPTKNGSLLPTQVCATSNKTVWWVCEKCGNEWQTKVIYRRLGYGSCPKCSKKERLTIADKKLNLSAFEEWDFDKNGNLSSSDVAFGSSKKVWWRCKKGHEWKATIYSRVSNGTGCPYCSGNKVLPGYNDLQSQYPAIAKDWDNNKNAISPCDVTSGSHKKFWWTCSKGHSYYTSVYSRTRKSVGCPYCTANNTSYPEQFIYWLLRSIYPDTKNREKYFGYEYDVVIPEKSLYIEYSGKYWHEGKEERSKKKEEAVKHSGGRYVEIVDDHNSYHMVKKGSQITINAELDIESKLLSIIKSLLPESASSIDELDIDLIKKYALEYSKGEIEKEKTLAETNPELSKDWCYEKNNGLTPYDVTRGSKKIVWWKCAIGHEYRASVNRRTSMHSGCPFCAGKRVIVGENDLASQDPKLADEWNYEKNGSLLPNQVTINASRRVWWKCKSCGNEWFTSVKARKSSGCPICGRLVANSKTRKSPEAFKMQIEEIHPSIELLTQYYNVKSRVRCRCKTCGEEWEALPAVLIRGGGCPRCTKERIRKNCSKTTSQFIDEMAAVNPSIKVLGEYTNSFVKVRCQCLNCDNIWDAQPHNLSRGHGCPRCARRKWKKRSSS